MADDRKTFNVTVPAGTPVFPPGVFPIAFNPARIVRVDWRVPPGAQSVLGWALGMGGVAVFPRIGDPFIVAAGESGSVDGGNLPDSGGWQVLAFNLGNFPHTLNLVFHLAFPAPAATVRPLWTGQDLGVIPDLSKSRPLPPPRLESLQGPL